MSSINLVLHGLFHFPTKSIECCISESFFMFDIHFSLFLVLCSRLDNNIFLDLEEGLNGIGNVASNWVWNDSHAGRVLDLIDMIWVLNISKTWSIFLKIFWNSFLVWDPFLLSVETKLFSLGNSCLNVSILSQQGWW
jgi:hypothetical protein